MVSAHFSACSNKNVLRKVPPRRDFSFYSLLQQYVAFLTFGRILSTYIRHSCGRRLRSHRTFCFGVLHLPTTRMSSTLPCFKYRTYALGAFLCQNLRCSRRDIWVVTHISSSLGRNKNSNFYFASSLADIRNTACSASRFSSNCIQVRKS